MTGGDGNDVYVVDDAGDVVTETTPTLRRRGDIDRVESDISYTLGANVENLDLNGGARHGTGNALNNIINGNGEAQPAVRRRRQRHPHGDDGNDLLDGGTATTRSTAATTTTPSSAAPATTRSMSAAASTRIVYNAAGFGNDIITSFDAAGGTRGNQDLIDLSALGRHGGELRDAGHRRRRRTGARRHADHRPRCGPRSAINRHDPDRTTSRNADIDVSRLHPGRGARPAPITGTDAGANTINGTAAAQTINGLGGNDTLNGAAATTSSTAARAPTRSTAATATTRSAAAPAATSALCRQLRHRCLHQQQRHRRLRRQLGRDGDDND